jgi:hypothetical protein
MKLLAIETVEYRVTFWESNSVIVFKNNEMIFPDLKDYCAVFIHEREQANLINYEIGKQLDNFQGYIIWYSGEVDSILSLNNKEIRGLSWATIEKKLTKFKDDFNNTNIENAINNLIGFDPILESLLSDFKDLSPFEDIEEIKKIKLRDYVNNKYLS